jgi:hypothetical protein
MRPLVPRGGRFATKDRRVADELACEMLVRSAMNSRSAVVSFDGSIATLISKYMAYARDYYVSADDAHSCEYDNIELSLQPLLLKHLPFSGTLSTTPILA